MTTTTTTATTMTTTTTTATTMTMTTTATTMTTTTIMEEASSQHLKIFIRNLFVVSDSKYSRQFSFLFWQTFFFFFFRVENFEYIHEDLNTFRASRGSRTFPYIYVQLSIRDFLIQIPAIKLYICHCRHRVFEMWKTRARSTFGGMLCYIFS